MSILIVGVSHKSAPVSTLERVTLDSDGIDKMLQRAVETPHVSEALVISTCNRVEIYVEAERFHGSVEDVTSLLVEHAGLARQEVLRHVYVHYDDAAVAHLFSVASGLDSMVVGESQIIGQVRAALQRGQEHATVGPALNVLFQQALRIAKRGHAETGIDQAGPSVVSAALDRVQRPLPQTRVLIVGAGAMAALAATICLRRDAAAITIVNRTPENAQRLADRVGGRAVAWKDIDQALAAADLVVTCTGAVGAVLESGRISSAIAGRTDDLTILDLAVPRDVEESAADLDGVTVFGLAELAEALEAGQTAVDVRQVRSIVSSEVSAFLSVRNASRVTPTVVALRSMATEVVDAELVRLNGRRPDLDPALAADIAQTVRRVADKLLHAPTVRIKELAGQPDASTYADALADLFALDRTAVEAVSSIDPASSQAQSSDRGDRT